MATAAPASRKLKCEIALFFRPTALPRSKGERERFGPEAGRRDKVVVVGVEKSVAGAELFHLFPRRGGGERGPGGADARGNPG